jgi:DNA-directed RNA polymerase specialized sigma24 family protein
MEVHREGGRKAIPTVAIEEWHDVATHAPQEHAVGVNMAIRLCDERQREIVLMRGAGYEHWEIAEVLGISRIWTMKLFRDARELVEVNAKRRAV